MGSLNIGGNVISFKVRWNRTAATHQRLPNRGVNALLCGSHLVNFAAYRTLTSRLFLFIHPRRSGAAQISAPQLLQLLSILSVLKYSEVLWEILPLQRVLAISKELLPISHTHGISAGRVTRTHTSTLPLALYVQKRRQKRRHHFDFPLFPFIT